MAPICILVQHQYTADFFPTMLVEIADCEDNIKEGSVLFFFAVTPWKIIFTVKLLLAVILSVNDRMYLDSNFRELVSYLIRQGEFEAILI